MRTHTMRWNGIERKKHFPMENLTSLPYTRHESDQNPGCFNQSLGSTQHFFHISLLPNLLVFLRLTRLDCSIA